MRNGALLIFISAVGYAFFSVFVKNIYAASDLTALDVLTWRFILATPLIWLIVGVRRTPMPELPRVRLLALGVVFTAVAGFAMLTLERIPASTYTMLLYTYPAFVVLLSLLLGERLAARGWLALGMTLAGIALTVPDFSTGLSNREGVMFGLLNSGTYAVYIVVSNRVLRGYSGLMQASAWGITGSLLAMLAVTLVRGLVIPSNATTWAYLLALATVSSVIPIVAFYAGLHLVGASRAAILSTLEPVLTLVLAVVLLGETMQAVQLIGGALILASVILLQLPKRTARVEGSRESSASLS